MTSLRRANFEAAVKVLIETVSGFQEGDENQEICMNYVLSNLNYHRFLDPDSHKIKRQINGLIDKFKVHSQMDNANRLQSLVQEYMNTVDEDSPTKMDACCAVLSLLLLLSDHPTGHEVSEKVLERAPSPEEDIDWAAILMEGEEVQREFPDSEWSDLEDEEENEQNEAAPAVENALDPPQRPGEENDDGFYEEDAITADSAISSQRSSMLPFASQDKGYAWLNENVVERYWRGPMESTGIQDASSRSVLLADQWADYTSRTDILGPSPKTAVLEQHIVREVIWALSGVEKLHLFDFQDGKWTPKADLIVSHLTPNSLVPYIDDACHYANVIRKFQHFCSQLTLNMRVTAEGSNICRTYFAFASALHKYLSEFQLELARFEKTTVEKGLLLSGLYQALKPRFAQLALIDQLYKDSIEAGTELCNVGKALALLRRLKEMIESLDSYGSFRASGMELLLPMYVETLRPYLSMMDQLITVGRVDDHTQEFVIRRDKGMKVTDERFWSDAYTLATASEKEESAKTEKGMVEEKEKSVQPKAKKMEQKEPVSNPDAVALFGCKILEDLFVTGKSMEILHHLGRLSDVQTEDQKSLHDSLLDEILVLKSSPGLGSVKGEAAKEDNNRAAAVVKNAFLSLDEDDRLILSNFENLVKLGEVKHEKKNETKEHQIKDCTLGAWPLERRVDEILTERVSARRKHVTSILFELLVRDYDIEKHLLNMRKYFLMEAGDIMYDFYTDIFEKIRNGEDWCDVSYLTVLLQESLTQYRQECDLFVHVDQSQASRRQPIHALDCLTLVYDVKWPASVVLGERCQNVYNAIFTWALQVKRAKYCLDGLHHSELCSRELSDEISAPNVQKLGHRIHLFRMKLLNFLNVLHDYIMSGVLHSKGHQFATSLSQTSDLADLLSLHTTFLSQTHAECLLTKNLVLLREAISKILNLSLVFHDRMENRGLTSLSSSDLVAMETELGRCLQFASSYLHNLTKHSASPHLECLAAGVLDTIRSMSVRS